MKIVRHSWNAQDQFCSCGQDVVTCQICGRPGCGSLAKWTEVHGPGSRKGNVCYLCRVLHCGEGHQGTPPPAEEPKPKALIPRVSSLDHLMRLAGKDRRYRKLLHTAAANLGAGTGLTDDGAYSHLCIMADTTNETGVVEEVNDCRDLV